MSPVQSPLEILMFEYVRAVEDLDVLLLLHRSAPRARTVEQVARHLALDPPTVATTLTSLTLGELAPVVLEPAGYACRPSTADLRAALEALAMAESEDRTQVLLRMSANAVTRLRSQTRDTFAILLEQQSAAATKRRGE